MDEETIPLTVWIAIFVILVICLFHETDRQVDPWGKDRKPVMVERETVVHQAVLTAEPTPTPRIMEASKEGKTVKVDDWWDILNRTKLE